MVFQSNLNLPNTNIDIYPKAEDELGSHVAPKIKEKNHQWGMHLSTFQYYVSFWFAYLAKPVHPLQ
jgi:hypothetical protein